MKVLISVRNAAEAQAAVAGGADFIDLKEPGQGALGGLPVGTIASVLGALRGQGDRRPVSATIGDLPATGLRVIQAQVQAVGASGVDYVKVGIAREPAAHPLLRWLSGCGWPVVPVFIADRGLDTALVDEALALRFPALMVDTDDKQAGSLFEVLDLTTLSAFVARARQAGVMVGLAGALRLAQLAALVRVGPDFAGFRSAVCAGGRADALDSGLVRALVSSLAALRGPQPVCIDVSPSSILRTRASSLP